MAKQKEILKEETKPKKHIVSTVFLVIFLLLTLLSFIFLPLLISLIIFVLFLFPILLYIILGKLTNHWLIMLPVVFLIQIILLAGLGYWIYSDAIFLMNNFQSQPKYLLYQDGKIIPLGFLITAEAQQELPFKILANDDIKSIIATINKKDKFVIIVKKEFFTPLPETIDANLGEQKLQIPKTVALELLKSDKPKEIVLEYMAIINAENLGLPEDMLEQIKQGNIPEQLKQEMEKSTMDVTDEQVKMLTLGLLFAKTIELKGTNYIFESFRNGNIIVKPFYISIWILEHIPVDFIKPFLPPELQYALSNIQLPIIGLDSYEGKTSEATQTTLPIKTGDKLFPITQRPSKEGAFKIG